MDTEYTTGGMSTERVLKSGVSVWAINFAISLVVTLVLIVLFVLMGMSAKSQTPTYFILGGIVSLVTGFLVAGFLFPRLCGWVMKK